MPFAEHLTPAAFANLKVLLGWSGVIAGLALFSWLMILADRRSARLAAAPVKVKRESRCPHRDWDLVTSIARAGQAQADAAMALHARAAERIDAAEYALNRLLAECAAVMMPSPALQPIPVLARGPGRFTHASLAA